jgi:hypothetical protein
MWSGSGLCDGPITRPEGVRLWCVVPCTVATLGGLGSRWAVAPEGETLLTQFVADIPVPEMHTEGSEIAQSV